MTSFEWYFAFHRKAGYIEKAEYVPPPPFEIPGLMQELIEWYRANKRKLPPLELAIILHTKIVTVHPFVDGNGRLGRALLNFVLKRNGYPTLYLGLEQREKYLDVVAEGNKVHYEPIIDFMCNTSEQFYSVSFPKQHFLYFFPDPQGHGSFRPIFFSFLLPFENFDFFFVS